MHEVWEYSEWPSLNLLVVVPTAARLHTLEAALAELRDIPKVARYSFFTSLGLYATTVEDLARQGPLAPVWWPLADRGPARALTQLTPRGPAADPAAALGRRWRHDRRDFWPRLSPLGRTTAAESGADLRSSEIAGFMDDPEPNEEG